MEHPIDRAVMTSIFEDCERRAEERIRLAVVAGVVTEEEVFNAYNDLRNPSLPLPNYPSLAVARTLLNPLTQQEPTMSTINARLTNLITAHLGVEASRVKPDAKLADDLGADSLDRVELLMACEEEFGIEIPDGEAERLKTVQEIEGYITRRAGV